MELKLENLTKSYGKKLALNQFSATLTSGIYGLLGPNGAGKSTMMKIITENLSADEGRILVDGAPSERLGEDYCAYAPAAGPLPPFYSMVVSVLYRCTEGYEKIRGRSGH